MGVSTSSETQMPTKLTYLSHQELMLKIASIPLAPPNIVNCLESKSSPNPTTDLHISTTTSSICTMPIHKQMKIVTSTHSRIDIVENKVAPHDSRSSVQQKSIHVFNRNITQTHLDKTQFQNIQSTDTSISENTDAYNINNQTKNEDVVYEMQHKNITGASLPARNNIRCIQLSAFKQFGHQNLTNASTKDMELSSNYCKDIINEIKDKTSVTT